MGSNNNKNQNGQKQYGDDPRGTSMNMINQQTQRYNQQQGPMVNAFAENYGRGSEANYGDYTDIMNQYRGIASGQDYADYDPGGGGGGGGGGYDAFTVNPERVTAERASVRSLGPLERVTAKEQFDTPYAGYQEFSQSGGYSPTDIANMRARGVSPIRAAYANAERNVGQQRSLQGGYSPNAIAAQAKMAREQGQSMADASQNVDAGIAEARNAGRLKGFEGMSDIGKARLQAQMEQDEYNAGQAFQGQQFDIGNEKDVNVFNAGQGNDIGQFNANLNYQGQTYNADAMRQAQAANNAAAAAGASSRAAANAANMDDRFRALSGMTSLYGATPGMANIFGNQLLSGVGQGGQQGLGVMGEVNNAGQRQGQFDQTTGRINQIGNMVSRGGNILSGFLNDRPQTSSGGYTGAPMNTGGPATFQPGGANTQQRRSIMSNVRF